MSMDELGTFSIPVVRVDAATQDRKQDDDEGSALEVTKIELTNTTNALEVSKIDLLANEDVTSNRSVPEISMLAPQKMSKHPFVQPKKVAPPTKRKPGQILAEFKRLKYHAGPKDADVDSKVKSDLVDSNPLFEAKNSTIQNTTSNLQQVSRRTAIHRVAKAPSKKVPPAANMTQQASLRKKSDESAQSAMKQRYTLSV